MTVARFAGKLPCLVVGHRGGRATPGDEWPTENTMASFARAHAEGADAIELDVRSSADGEVVVMHDPTLARVTGGTDTRAVAELTRAELATVSIGSNGERVAFLDDVLTWARDRLAVNVEAKHDLPRRAALLRPLARTLARHPRTEVLVSSFDPALLAGLALLAPQVARAWLTHEGEERWSFAWSRLVTRAPILAVHLERTQTRTDRIVALHRAGKRVGVWTVNDPDEARDLAASGVDWIVTDAPARILEAIRR